jgi:peptide-methionine (S)-S-oxide reductase
VFERVKEVLKTTVGYSGGSASTATYDQVTTETTGHAESVEVIYDPSQITYGQLFRVYFSVVHDPTQLNRQGPDVGTSYRSAIFYVNEEQKPLPLRTSDNSMRRRHFINQLSRRSRRSKGSIARRSITRTMP